MPHNNPEGKNGYKNRRKIGDPEMRDMIYPPRISPVFESGLSTPVSIYICFLVFLYSFLLLYLSSSSISRHKAFWGIKAGGATTRSMDDVEKRQLVLYQMAKDPEGRKGPRTIRKDILAETGVLLTRDFVAAEMRAQDPEGFLKRDCALTAEKAQASKSDNAPNGSKTCQ
ncbi:hypothetical protein D9758_017109 [Tetrapyrgos nigripes]|uniref:Uncharacterized protein n=1 Tax=Tetrapyrgos nigripes TaxID=182062 RepID=A0A8H5FEI9_9AGAR|nr:hypothetical protein D9758_017109 [Tetrapyrgos nigripes]